MRRLLTLAVVSLAVMTGAASAQSEQPRLAPGQEVATFAGGCFWCVESDFDKVDGVIATVSGFMGGRTPNPTYKQVTFGDTGHLEVVQITFDPKKVSYAKLLDAFWKSVDPYDDGGQFCDRGDSYRTAIFTHSDEQKQLADAAKAELQKSGPLKQPIVTRIIAGSAFTAAEDYHQNFHTTNPVRYKYYRHGCGRDARLETIWGKKATQ